MRVASVGCMDVWGVQFTSTKSLFSLAKTTDGCFLFKCLFKLDDAPPEKEMYWKQYVHLARLLSFASEK